MSSERATNLTVTLSQPVQHVSNFVTQLNFNSIEIYVSKLRACFVKSQSNKIFCLYNETKMKFSSLVYDTSDIYQNRNSSVTVVRFYTRPIYSRTPLTRTLKGNENLFELAGFRVIGVD